MLVPYVADAVLLGGHIEASAATSSVLELPKAIFGAQERAIGCRSSRRWACGASKRAFEQPIWLGGQVDGPLQCHCQVPCGIFHDDGRIAAILEDAMTIRKAVVQCQELHKSGKLQEPKQLEILEHVLKYTVKSTNMINLYMYQFCSVRGGGPRHMVGNPI